MSEVVVGFAGMTHLGVNSSAASAAHGFETVCFDPNLHLIEQLRKGHLPVVENGLYELIQKHANLIHYTSKVDDLRRCDVVYIAADITTNDEGKSDLLGIQTLIDQVSEMLSKSSILVILCQVPPGFTRNLSMKKNRLFYQVETLIFGQAVERAMHPERFIVGCIDPYIGLPKDYNTFLSAFHCPILPMRYESAELAKISINCCLVASITVANTLAELCERVGADWSEIFPALKLDKRIGPHAYLVPGLGLAGGNLERDLATVLRLGENTGSDVGLINAFVWNSHHRRDWVLRILHEFVLNSKPDAVIGILGLAYKENTHSTKNSAALALIEQLKPWTLRVYDPAVPVSVVKHPKVLGCSSALEVIKGIDVLVIMSPWKEFKALRADQLLQAMTGRSVIDPYHMLDSKAIVAEGFDYFTLGAKSQYAMEKVNLA